MMQPLPQVVLKDPNGQYKMKVVCYQNASMMHIIDTEKNMCLSMNLDTYEFFAKNSEELLTRGRTMEVSILIVSIFYSIEFTPF